MTSPTVIVKIGPEGKEYILHTELLKHHSGYFRGALSGAFKETDDGVIPITDVDTDAFDTFVDWIYRGTVNTEPQSPSNILSRSYILADRLIMPGLKSALMDHCYHRYTGPVRNRPTCGMIVRLCNNLPKEDPLLRLCLDIWSARKAVYNLDQGEKAELSNLPHEFLVRLMLRMHELGEKPTAVHTFMREDYNERVRTDG